VPLNPTTGTSVLSLNQYLNGSNFLALDENVFRAVHLQILPLAFENKQKEQDNLCEASLPTIYSPIYTGSFYHLLNPAWYMKAEQSLSICLLSFWEDMAVPSS